MLASVSVFVLLSFFFSSVFLSFPLQLRKEHRKKKKRQQHKTNKKETNYSNQQPKINNKRQTPHTHTHTHTKQWVPEAKQP